MSNRQQRNARKAAVRAGDKSQQFVHKQPDPSTVVRHETRRERQQREREFNRASAELMSKMGGPMARALANIRKH